jgi:hypothetical protein
MDAAHFIRDYRYLRDHFNRDEYPAMFDRVSKDLKEYFSEFPSDPAAQDETAWAAASEILDEVEANTEQYRFKFRKESARADDHIVLSVFIVPAAAHIGTAVATKFAGAIAACWEERFPGSTFKIGDYDEIMEGFKWKITLFSK